MSKRDTLILQKLEQQGSISVTQLAAEYQVSVESIRRDLNRLEKQGLLFRTHGGASSKQTKDLGAYFQKRQYTNVEAKQHIARLASQLLYENAVIGLDASSTSWYFANAMPNIPCTVVTNSMHNISALVNKPNIKSIVTGGVYSAKYSAFYGPLSEYLLQRLHINFAVFSCSAIDNDGNIWESNELNVAIKRKIMEASEQNYLLVDSSKFNRKNLLQFAELSDINSVFTEVPLPQPLQQYCESHNVVNIYE